MKKKANARYDLVNTAFHSPLLEKPEDVAQAVWKAVKHKRKDVVLGTAKLWTTLHHKLPGLMNPIFRRFFGMGEL